MDQIGWMDGCVAWIRVDGGMPHGDARADHGSSTHAARTARRKQACSARRPQRKQHAQHGAPAPPPPAALWLGTPRSSGAAGACSKVVGGGVRLCLVWSGCAVWLVRLCLVWFGCWLCGLVWSWVVWFCAVASLSHLKTQPALRTQQPPPPPPTTHLTPSSPSAPAKPPPCQHACRRSAAWRADSALPAHWCASVCWVGGVCCWAVDCVVGSVEGGGGGWGGDAVWLELRCPRVDCCTAAPWPSCWLS